MSKNKLIVLIVVAVIVVCGVGYYGYTTVKANTVSENTGNSLKENKPLFSTAESNLYYKLEQAVGDEGMPSNSITVNLNNTVTINGKAYYKVYNYATRSAYTTPEIYEGENNNFSQLISEPIYVSESGGVIKDASSSTSTEFNNI